MKQPKLRLSVRALIEELEPRLLFSADFAPAFSDSISPQAEQRWIGPDGDFSPPETHDQAAQGITHEVVFIDTRVQAYESFLADIQSQNSGTRQFEVVLLDMQQDGVSQISEFLKQRHDISAIHLISHGNEGVMELGAGQLDFDTLLKQAASIKQWGNALSSEADILLYGCDLAGSEAGKSLINALSQLTGADVAASTNKTGAAALGADWILEYQTGVIQTQVVISEYNQQSWQGILATFTVTTTSSGGMGSLFQAINMANAAGGADTIVFNIAGGGVQTINLTFALPAITGSLVIDGTSQPGYAGTPLIVLNGTSAGAGVSGLTINTSNVTIRGLAINNFDQNGILLDGVAATGNTIVGNYIGTDATGTIANGNSLTGIRFINGAHDNLVGGTTAADANLIAFNGWGVGVATGAGTGNSILGNAIHSNTNLGINLGATTVDLNDLGDADTGANNLQNYPVLTSASTSGTQISIGGSLNSNASSYYRVEFFASTSADATGYGEGQRYLGYVNIATDGSGNATFSQVVTASVATGEFISATATRSEATYTTFTDTSEFAQNIVATANTAPTLDASKSPAFAAINEDAPAPVGAVGSLVASLVDFAAPTGQVDNVTDPDAGAQLGIAITAANTANGAWWYSLDNGANWNALGTMSAGSARLLAADASTRLYFQPNANLNGTLSSAITIRAWDQTSGSNGGLGNTTVNGGNSAFSTATDTVSLVINAVNDAPVITSNGGGTTAAINVQENTTAVTTITSTDIDGGTPVYTITGGADAAKFTLNSATGVLSFIAAPDYETPADSNFDNIYLVTIQVSDGNGGTDTQALSVTVTNQVGNLSGTVYIDEGSTAIGAGKSIRLVINGIGIETAITNASGGYAFKSEANVGDAVLVFIDNDASYKANTISVVNGGDVSALNLYAGHVIVRHDNGGALTIANMTTARGGYSDTDLLYSTPAGTLTIAALDTELFVPVGHTFAPGGNLNVDSIEIRGTLTGGVNTYTVAANWDAATGTFVANGSTVSVLSRLSGFTFTPGSSSYNNVTINANNRFLTLGGNLTVTNNFTNNSSGVGTLTIGAQTITTKNLIWSAGYFGHSAGANIVASGDVTVSGSSGFFSGSGSGLTLTLNGNADTTFTPGTYTWGNVVLNKSTQTNRVTLTTNPLNLANGSSLSLNSGIFNLAGNNLNLGTGSSFSNTGALWLLGSETLSNFANDIDSGSVVYNGAGNYSGLRAGSAYYHLGFSNTAGTWTLGTALDVNGDLNISSGTLDVNNGGNYAINVAGNWSNTGIFLARSGTVFLDGGNQSLSGSTTFNNLSKIETSNNATDSILTFSSTGTQTVTGLLTLTGLDNDDRINLVSSNPVSQWNLNLTATASVNLDFIDVTDSNASGSDASQLPLMPTNSINGGNNTGWFGAASAAPVISLPGPALNFTENDTPTVIDGSATASDADSMDFNSGTLTVSLIANGSAEDRLAIRNQGTGIGQIGVSGSNVSYGGVIIGMFTGGTDGTTPLVITFNLLSSPAAAQALMQNITYGNVSENPNTATRTVRFVLTDGDGSTSNAATQSINITAVNDTPTTSGIPNVTVNEDALVTFINFASRFSDAEEASASLIYTITGNTNPGLFSALNLSGSSLNINYASNQNGVANLTIRATDSGGLFVESTFTITVNPVNDAPSLNSTPVVAFTPITEDDVNNPGDLVSFLINGAITDVDVGALQGIAIHATSLTNGFFEYSTNDGTSWNSVGAVTNSSALLLRDTDRIRFVPNGTNAGSGAILYWAWDQTSGATGTKVNASTRGGTTAFSTGAELATVNASGVNDAPVITSNGGGTTASTSAPENSTYVTTVTASDPDVPVQTLSYSITGGGDASKFTIDSASGVLSFTLPPSYENPQGSLGGGYVYEVTVTASDGSLTGSQTLQIIVWNVNDPPVITSNGGGDTATVNVAENSTAVTTVTATDEDFGPQTLTYSITGGADAGHFSINSATGVLRFVTAPNFEAPTDAGANNIYDVIVRVMDSAGGIDTQAIAVRVINVNEAPVANNDSYVINEDGGGFLPMPGVLGNDSDVDSASLTAILVSGASNGSLTLNSNGSFWYWPTPNFNGVDSFTYRVSDGALFSNIATVTITINPVNDAPVAVADAFSGNEDTPITGNVLANDTDIDSPTLTAALVSGPANGGLTLNNNGSFVYTPNANYFGTDSFTYRANDGALNSAITTVSITVNSVNDAPFINTNSLTILEGESVVLNTSHLNATDVDHGPAQLVFTISNVVYGQFEMLAAPGVAITSFTQADINAGLVVFAHDTSDFAPAYDVTVSDGSLTQGPQAATISFATVNEGINVTALSGLTTTETGGFMTFDVMLNSQPFANVTLVFGVDLPAEGSLSVPSLTFTSANWNIAQRMMVTGLPDLINDGNQAYRVQLLSIVTTDRNYAALTLADIQLTNLDNPSYLIPDSPATLPTGASDASPETAVDESTEPTSALAVSLPASAAEPVPDAAIQHEIGGEPSYLGLPETTYPSAGHNRTDLGYQQSTQRQTLTDPASQSELLLQVLQIIQVDPPASGGSNASHFLPTPVEFTQNEDFRVDIYTQGVEITAVTLSVGTVWWALRIGGLFASLLTSLPAWRSFDLLPVLDRKEGDDDADWDEKPTAPDAPRTPT